MIYMYPLFVLNHRDSTSQFSDQGLIQVNGIATGTSIPTYLYHVYGYISSDPTDKQTTPSFIYNFWIMNRIFLPSLLTPFKL